MPRRCVVAGGLTIAADFRATVIAARAGGFLRGGAGVRCGESLTGLMVCGGCVSRCHGACSMSRPIQSIAGVSPPEVVETTVMTVWPSVASTGFGRRLGRFYRMRSGVGPFTTGRLALLATIPLGLMLYLSLRLPWAIARYRLTNRRVLVEQGINPLVRQFVDLSGFDTIDVETDPGQEWYAAGDLVFRRGTTQVLRLAGVSRPESFRRTCLEAKQSFTSVESLRPSVARAR